MVPLITFDDMNVADFLRMSSHFSRSLCNSLIQRFAALSKEAWKSEGHKWWRKTLAFDDSSIWYYMVK